MSERMHQICRGEALTPEKCEAYRKLWAGERKTGLGDVVRMVTKATGVDKAAKAVATAVGARDCGCAGRQKTLNKLTTKRRPFAMSKDYRAEFVTTRQLTDDVMKLASELPPCITRIAGVSRSGLTPAALLAQLLHVPLDVVRPKFRDVVSGSNGWRLGHATRPGTTLVVDDTMMSGNSCRDVWPIAQAHYEDPQFAVIYWNPNASEVPHYYARELRWPHILEWNLFNSILTPCSAFDMDGVICQDCPTGDDDDGPRYLRFLEGVRPKYLVRRTKIPLIVTGRIERYREHTSAWLAKWGIQVANLVMRPDHKTSIVDFKAKQFRLFLKRRIGPGPSLFIESCPHQSQAIARKSGGLVVCPTNGECYKG